MTHLSLITTKPENRNTVGGRWVYAIKTDPKGEGKYKARFVAKGYLQIPGYYNTAIIMKPSHPLQE